MINRTIGNFVLRQKVGQGGMGAVYLGQHTRLDRRAAIKVLLPELAADPELVARFLNEARAVAEIKHPHVIEISDFGELDDGTSYLVMEWLDGVSLGQRLSEARLPVTRALAIGRDIAAALEVAHAAGVVHRDLKPDNVFLVEDAATTEGNERVKVLDFGIAKLLDGRGALHTQTGTIIGTPGYMSPEQCRGEKVDPRADIYALGVMLYEMLGGRLPFVAEGMGELLYLHASVEPPPLSALLPHASPTLTALVHRALAKNPADRWPTARALGDALTVELTGRAPSRTAPRAERAKLSATFDAFAATGLGATVPPVERRGAPRWWPLVGASVMTMLAITAVVGWRGRPGPTPTPTPTAAVATVAASSPPTTPSAPIAAPVVAQSTTRKKLPTKTKAPRNQRHAATTDASGTPIYHGVQGTLMTDYPGAH